ncbi:hypothetical protein A6X20_02685 [Bradyrhizobium elkanii]|nr:hypothetical protein A6X20_02685 [Bradyrhizobium elkanii]ODM84128.1 hypothetical protein A6452_15205 [Bradyrhizobium elkanii]
MRIFLLTAAGPFALEFAEIAMISDIEALKTASQWAESSARIEILAERAPLIRQTWDAPRPIQ